MSKVAEPAPDIYGSHENLALGQEQKTIVNWQANIATNYWVPASRQLTNPRLRFYTLSTQWKEETKYLSSISQVVMNSAYQQIIGMGPLALPFIFEELKMEPRYWFWALKAITGWDPVPENYRGNIEKMTQLWMKWGNNQGYVSSGT